MRLIDDGLELLDEADCRRLVAGSRVGRVAITIGALPAVLPVNYAVLPSGDIVFLTGEGTKLRAAVSNAIVAFEVDEIDVESETGWSVMAVGEASEVDDEREAAEALALGLRPWAGTSGRHHVVRIRPAFVSGRRIAPVAGPPGASQPRPGR